MNKLEALKDTYTDDRELELVLSKVIDMTLGQYRMRLQRYDRDLRDFEQQYDMDSRLFYRRFEAGDLGDATDFFEWAGLWELRQNLLEKIERLESAA